MASGKPGRLVGCNDLLFLYNWLFVLRCCKLAILTKAIPCSLQDYDSLISKVESTIHSKLTNLQKKLVNLQVVFNFHPNMKSAWFSYWNFYQPLGSLSTSVTFYISHFAYHSSTQCFELSTVSHFPFTDNAHLFYCCGISLYSSVGILICIIFLSTFWNEMFPCVKI